MLLPTGMRHDFTLREVRALHDLPLLELVHRAQTVHREHFGDNKVQLSSLLSVKTGGFPQDWPYCPQAARYQTRGAAGPLMAVDDRVAASPEARHARAARVASRRACRAWTD